MRRKIDDVLKRWAASDGHRPLLIRGARRVGKTYALKRLGDDAFPGRFAYCDFQTNRESLSAVFDGPIDVGRIVRELSVLLRTDITEGETLIAFDEIQLCEPALNSLRFFAQTGHRVVATGSQLGIAMRDRSLPFPSDVDQVLLPPLDFEEYLWARGEGRMADAIRDSFADRSRFVLHDQALGLYREYCVTGGMPLVVADYAEHGDFDRVRTLQAEIDQTYTADIALYAPAGMAAHAQAIWSSIPRQLARETTRKFKYSDVSPGARERGWREPLAWLEAASIVALHYQTNDTAAPLVARNDGAFFKVYFRDTGILFYRFNLAALAYLDERFRRNLSAAFRGAVAENYVMQALCANDVESFYWTPGTTSRNEVEFVVQSRYGQVVPIEVKSGDNVASASLRAYCGKSAAPVAVRVSAKNFGFDGGLFSVPLYAAFCLDQPAIDALCM